jgi:hypothetical protein
MVQRNEGWVATQNERFSKVAGGEAADARTRFPTPTTVRAPSADPITSLPEQLRRNFRTRAVLFYLGTWSYTLNYYLGLRWDAQALETYRVNIHGRIHGRES